MDSEFLCRSCVNERESGRSVTAELVCQECFEYATTEVSDLEGVRGRPEIRIRPEPINMQLRRTALPKEAGQIVDIAPIVEERRARRR
jgi:hypothetical protein